MHPSGQPPPQNRSCSSPSLVQCPSPSPSLLQQQQHVLFGPITSLQPCTTNLHPHCVYTQVQKKFGLSGTSASLSNQVPIRPTKVAKWQTKSKPTRGHQHHHPNHHHHQQYCQPLQNQQAHVQQPLTYIPKPSVVVFDQCPINQPPPGVRPAAASFLVTSSTFPHSPYAHSDPYATAPGLTLIPQPYLKLPEVPQAFCLLPERPQPPHHHQQPLVGQTQGPYYNVSAANTCGLQPVNPRSAFQLSNIANAYGNIPTFGSNQIAVGQANPVNQIFQNPPVSLASFGSLPRDKLSMVSSVDVQAMTCSRNLRVPEERKRHDSVVPRAENIEWPVQTARETSNNVFDVPDGGISSRISLSPIQTNRLHSSIITKNQEERYSDESAASFDFTIEAEKMVSALCNTASSNDLCKDEARGKNEGSTSFGGAAGDSITNKTNAWFADFCHGYGVSIGQNNRTVSTQTQDDKQDFQRYLETMRKTIYWGCNEAENILDSTNYRGSSRARWLKNISCATRTAVMKSSTCFPIYPGDRTFVQDLVKALLRISNGWLVLDNYLNKQHYASLDEKFDGELTRHFETWEIATIDLMRALVKTLVNVEESVSNCSASLETMVHQENSTNASFPGDVNLYTSADLFDSFQNYREDSCKFNSCPKTDRNSTYTLRYATQSTSHPNVHSLESQQQSQKETKLRSKWTITENLSSTIDGTKSIPDVSIDQTESGFSANARLRVKNSANASSTKFTSSARHSLNTEFFHLRNKVMESIGNPNESDRQRWGLDEQQYDLFFGRGANTRGIVPVSCEPIFKIKQAGTSYENAYARRCLPRVNSMNSTARNTLSHCPNVDGSTYPVAGAETALDSTYKADVGAPKDLGKACAEPDYTGNVGISELNEHNCGSGLVISATSVTNLTQDPVYVGKSSSDQLELAAVPKTKMTLLSQIEGNTPNTNRDTKEMTANLSAWFASMRNSKGHRTINCSVERRKNHDAMPTRTSTHPQETSRSAMDLNRQLYMDGNRQLQTLQNMQAIQSQPWNASNLLNNKRTSGNVHHLDEYDSSEDVRVYMKPGSYNVPKKRHHRKNTRRGDNPGSSRIINNTPRSHTTRGGHGANYNGNSGAKNPVVSSVSTLLIASSVQVSTTTTATSTTIRVPFPANPVVPPPANFSLQTSPRILRRVRSFSNQEKRQDVAWKAACASAEILLEALNVQSSGKDSTAASRSPNSMKNAPMDFTSGIQDSELFDRVSCKMDTAKNLAEDCFGEASGDDSSSTCKISPSHCRDLVSRDCKQTRTNVKTDSWLIRTLSNASIASTINAKKSNAESIAEGSLNSSTEDDLREPKTVVTSTPEPVKNCSHDSAGRSAIATRNPADSFPKKPTTDSPRGIENCERSGSSTRETPTRMLSASLVDTSGEFIGKATYSETVRRTTGKSYTSGNIESYGSKEIRSMGSFEPMAGSSFFSAVGKKSQRKENDKLHQSINKSKKSVAKRQSRDLEEREIEEGLPTKKIVKEDGPGESSTRVSTLKSQAKKKDAGNSSTGWVETKSKVGERGWSVWYSSRRRQTLSPLELNKLATIHQAVWEMDEAKLLKYPSSTSGGSGTPIEKFDDECRVIKSPMFLEAIGYKLKHRIYHKIEQAQRDFRKIVNNSKLHNKHDTDRITKIETLSKKLEELFDEHFANCDFENISGSPRNNNGLSSVTTSRCKSPRRQQQKSASMRTSNVVKKNQATSAKNEK